MVLCRDEWRDEGMNGGRNCWYKIEIRIVEIHTSL